MPLLSPQSTPKRLFQHPHRSQTEQRWGFQSISSQEQAGKSRAEEAQECVDTSKHFDNNRQEQNSLGASRDLSWSRVRGGTNPTIEDGLQFFRSIRKPQNDALLSQEAPHTWAPPCLFHLSPCQPHRVSSALPLLPPAPVWPGCSAAAPRCQLDVIINKVIDYLPPAGLEPADKL